MSRQRIVAAGDAARRRLERDLHDGVQQQLIAQLLGLRRIQLKLDKDPASAATLLGDSIESLETAIAELRELARGLHPTVLTRAGLAAAIAGLAARFSLPVTVDSSPPASMDASAEAAIYYVCCESLTNIAKHAAASCVRISLRSDSGAVLLEVEDDGTGLAGVEAGGGLEGLRDRLSAAGGRLEVESSPGRGTTIRARVPAVSTDPEC